MRANQREFLPSRLAATEPRVRLSAFPPAGRRLVSALVVSSLLLAAIPPRIAIAQSVSQTAAMSRSEYEACQARDEASFRQAISGLTLKGLQVGLAKVDYNDVVADAWRGSNLDDVLDRQVDAAINEVSEENSYWAKATSLFSNEKAQELATTVAERVFKSEAMKRGLETLGLGVGQTLGKRIELAAADTAEPAMQCIQAFLGPRYGSTIARVVSRDAGKEYSLDARANPSISTGQVIGDNAGGIAGAVILIVRRQLANMASRVGARIVGSVLSRLVSVVAGGVGVVLIAKDIWDLRNGVLPIISSEMKSAATKTKIRAELATAMNEQIGENIKEIATKTADRVVEVWGEFRRAHAKVLEIAEKNDDFRRFLDNVKPEGLARLDEAVALILASEGEGGILKRLADGTLDGVVNKMPDLAFDIARESRSLETALKWSALAGENLQQVVSYEIHRRTKPETLTKASLTQLLAVADKLAVGRLAALEPNARTPLFELPVNDLRNLGRSLTEGELDGLARYITALDKSAAGRLLSAVSQTPSRMQVLGRPAVRDAILASKDQSAAVAMMLRSDVVPDPWMVAEHARLALDGKISAWLLWEKHPVFVAGAALLVLIVLGFLKRLILPRRPRVIVREVSAPPIATPKPAAAPPPPSAAAPPIRSGRSKSETGA